MAIENYISRLLKPNPQPRSRPFDEHGKLRIQYFDVEIETAGSPNSTVELCTLPPGAVRVLTGMSRLGFSGFGGGRTLDIGHKAYRQTSDYSEPDAAEDPVAFGSAIDLSGAVTGVDAGSGVKFDIYSKDGVTVFGTLKGGAINVGAKMSGYIVYVYE